MSTRTTVRPRRLTFAAIAYVVGVSIVFFTLTSLALAAVPYVGTGRLPSEAYVHNYVEHPTPALLHVVPGLIFILGAPFQLSARFRRRHLTLHRRMGRVLILSGIVAATSALYVGIDHPWDGWAESSATIVFGSWLLWCLFAAFAAIRRRDVTQHRRWMIRAFATALAISTVRIWTGLFIIITAAQAGGPPKTMFPLQGTFGLSFWLGWTTNVVFAEWWIRRPAPVKT